MFDPLCDLLRNVGKNFGYKDIKNAEDDSGRRKYIFGKRSDKKAGAGRAEKAFKGGKRVKRGFLNKTVSHIKKEQVFCMAVAVLFAIGSYISSGSESFLKEGNKIERSAYGDIDREYELTVEGLFDEEEKLTVEVGARRYTKEEAEELYDELAEKLPALICGGNDNLFNIREDINLMTSLPEYGIKLTWYPEDAELISYDGEVRNENLKEGRDSFLKVIFSDGYTTATYDLPVTVLPRLMDERETLLTAFKNSLKEADENQIYSKELVLPAEFEGRKLSYKKELDLNPILIIALGLVAAISLSFKEKSDELSRLKKREEELLIDYSELVSKLMVFLGAGFGIRGAWEKIVEGYEKALSGGGRQRVVYEEMKLSLYELQRGVSEGKVYMDFGRRCRLRPYIKLCSLLEQNRKNGGKNLKTLLNAEMAEAFLERKNIAKRLGEEAGTKLLMPLFIMLMIVMAIVILPAMLALN